MGVDFRSLTACEHRWCFTTRLQMQRKRKCSKYFPSRLKCFCPDSNVKLAENPFINIHTRCMSAILDPERATECSWWCFAHLHICTFAHLHIWTFAHLHDTKCTPGGRVHNIRGTINMSNDTGHSIGWGTWQFAKPSLEVVAMQVANVSLVSLQQLQLLQMNNCKLNCCKCQPGFICCLSILTSHCVEQRFTAEELWVQKKIVRPKFCKSCLKVRCDGENISSWTWVKYLRQRVHFKPEGVEF